MTLSTIRVLYIDSDLEDAVFVQALLQHSDRAQFQFEHVLTYEQAIEQLRAGAYDVCLSDYQLYERTALDLLQTIQALQLAVPTIVVTDVADSHVEHEVLAAGASDFLEKNEIGRRVLQRAIRHALERASIMQELYQQQQEMAQIQHFNEQVLLSVPYIIYVYDLEQHRNVFSNRQISDLLGYSVEEVQARGSGVLQDLMHPDDFAAYAANIGRFDSAQDGEVLELEYRMQRKDGSWCWLRSRDTIFERTETGQARLVLGTAEDITAQKEAEAQIAVLALEQERARLLKTFVRDTSHDLRTPLSIIQTSAHLLMRVQDPQRRQHYYQMIDKQVNDLTGTLKNMVFLTELDSRSVIERQTINVVQLVKQVQTRMMPLAERQEHQLSLSLPLQPVYIEGNAFLFQQALTNIVENALLHTAPGTKVQLALTVARGEVVIRVSDDGAGIEEAHLAHLFERFYKVNDARTTDETGSGLGLAISQRIVTLHSGSVSVESQLNCGTTFSLRVACAEVENQLSA